MPDNVTSMMWNRGNGPPWHGKGKPVNGLATAAECIKAAGLDWGVAKMPLRISDEAGLPVPGKMVTVRTDLPPNDPRRILGIVGDEYQPLQNWDAFGFFDRIIEANTAIYETAGAIENGKRIWLLVRIPRTLHPAKDDEVFPYLLLANGHDGSLMLHIKFTPIRVVCQNTLAMALIEKDKRIAIRHDRNLRKRLEDAATLLDLVNLTIRTADNLWKRMVKRSLGEKDALRYFYSVFGGEEPEEDTEQPPKPLKGLKQKAMDNFDSGENRRLGIQGTLWAAYNGAIWAVDWERKTQKDRVDDLCLDEGALLKEKALKEAEKILNINA